MFYATTPSCTSSVPVPAAFIIAKLLSGAPVASISQTANLTSHAGNSGISAVINESKLFETVYTRMKLICSIDIVSFKNTKCLVE
jgi:hypothetical protein